MEENVRAYISKYWPAIALYLTAYCLADWGTVAAMFCVTIGWSYSVYVEEE